MTLLLVFVIMFCFSAVAKQCTLYLYTNYAYLKKIACGTLIMLVIFQQLKVCLAMSAF